MGAGKEMDEAVAVLMGWKRVDDLSDEEVAAYIKEGWQSDRIPTKDDIHNQRMRWIVGGECDCAKWMRSDGIPCVSIPHYSTDIIAAFQVVNMVVGKKYVEWTLEMMWYDGPDYVMTFHGADSEYKANGVTIPEAICGAALMCKICK